MRRTQYDRLYRQQLGFSYYWPISLFVLSTSVGSRIHVQPNNYFITAQMFILKFAVLFYLRMRVVDL